MRSGLKRARLEKGWTQAEAAAQFGITERAYRAWELGSRTPTYKKMLELQRVFERSVEELFVPHSTTKLVETELA